MPFPILKRYCTFLRISTASNDIKNVYVASPQYPGLVTYPNIPLLKDYDALQQSNKTGTNKVL
jgi:hypothetical protein